MAGAVVATNPEWVEVAHQLLPQAIPRAQPLRPHHPHPEETTPMGEAGAQTGAKTEVQATMAEAETSSKIPICLTPKGTFQTSSENITQRSNYYQYIMVTSLQTYPTLHQYVEYTWNKHIHRISHLIRSIEFN
jgi:hypothetical protein